MWRVLRDGKIVCEYLRLFGVAVFLGFLLQVVSIGPKLNSPFRNMVGVDESAFFVESAASRESAARYSVRSRKATGANNELSFNPSFSIKNVAIGKVDPKLFGVLFGFHVKSFKRPFKFISFSGLDGGVAANVFIRTHTNYMTLWVNRWRNSIVDKLDYQCRNASFRVQNIFSGDKRAKVCPKFPLRVFLSLLKGVTSEPSGSFSFPYGPNKEPDTKSSSAKCEPSSVGCFPLRREVAPFRAPLLIVSLLGFFVGIWAWFDEPESFAGCGLAVICVMGVSGPIERNGERGKAGKHWQQAIQGQVQRRFYGAMSGSYWC